MAFEVRGVDELLRKLEKVQSELQPRILAQSMRASLVPMLKAARANAPEGDKAHRTSKGRLVAPGFLKRNIRLRRLRFMDKTRIGYSIKARGEAFYGGFQETGYTHKGGKAKAGKQTKIQGKSWLGKAEEEYEASVSGRFNAEVLKRIEKASR